MSVPIESSLRRERSARGLSQERMAELGGISRQSYAAIESGASVPSTAVALRLARGMGVPVEELFRLADEPPRTVTAEPVETAGGPTPVRLARVGGKTVAVPVRSAGGGFRPADGVGEVVSATEMRVELFDDRPRPCDLVAIGCDPSFELVAAALRESAGFETVTVSGGSRAALDALAQGHAHVAGVHLLDAGTGGYNGSWVRRLVPFPCTRVRFAEWQQALVLPAGNPEGIAGVDDLARPGLRFLNREPGSGTRALIDTQLHARGVPQQSVGGYRDTVAHGHLAVAQGIASGLADVGVAIRAAGLALGLDTIVLAEEPYDLVIPDHHLDLPAVRALLDLLRTRALRAQVDALGGYDVQSMGLPVG